METLGDLYFKLSMTCFVIYLCVGIPLAIDDLTGGDWKTKRPRSYRWCLRLVIFLTYYFVILVAIAVVFFLYKIWTI